MKYLRCPQCKNVIAFDDRFCETGHVVAIKCTSCGKKFGLRIKAEAYRLGNESQKECQESSSSNKLHENCGEIVVIENKYCYRQVLPLHMGDNLIGRRKENYVVDCPIESGDLNIDYRHCVITVSRRKNGGLQYVLRDNPSNKGTYVEGTRLAPKERRAIGDGAVFTIGLTSVMLKLS